MAKNNLYHNPYMPICVVEAAFPVDLHGYFSDEDRLKKKNILGQATQVI